MQIIGKGGFGREVASYCEANNIEVFQFENECKGMNAARDAVIAIGNEETREKIVEENEWQSWGRLLFGKNYSNCSIGEGCIICPGAILTVNVKLGRHSIVNINCTIGHDVTINDFVTINPGVNISGSVSIGSNCNIGSNVVIRNGIKVCDDVVIGAGSVVVKDITEPGIYVGSPSVRLDRREKHITQDGLNKLQDHSEQMCFVLQKQIDDLKTVKATDTVSIRMTNQQKKKE
jgi:sugar O-acyltransferase (sialic acid O-acetyltransferase NeuD family)